MNIKFPSPLNFVQKWIKKFFDFVCAREKKCLLWALIIIFIIPLLFLEQPHQLLTLIVSMYANEWGGLAVWLAVEKPFWQTVAAYWSVTTVNTILLYLGIDLGKIIFLRIRNFVLRKNNGNRPPKNNCFSEKIRGLWNKFKKKLEKFFDWLSHRHIAFLYFLWLLPFIPYLGVFIVVLIKIRGIKSGIWIMMGLGILRAFLTLWIIQHGFNLNT